jgi:hypothetical protein
MSLPNYVFEPGTIFVAPGGGGAPQPLSPTAPGQVLISTLASPGAAFQLPLGQVTSGAAATKGSFTLASGTHAQIATTAVNANSSINYTVTALGTVTVASSFLSTIQSGVGFTPVASQNTDTSTVNWAIVA